MTREKYDCSRNLNGYVESFESLQCAIRACTGHQGDPVVLEMICMGCENYFPNRQQRDWKEVDSNGNFIIKLPPGNYLVEYSDKRGGNKLSTSNFTLGMLSKKITLVFQPK